MTKMQYETEERQKREEVKDGSPNSFFCQRSWGTTIVCLCYLA